MNCTYRLIYKKAQKIEAFVADFVIRIKKTIRFDNRQRQMSFSI